MSRRADWLVAASGGRLVAGEPGSTAAGDVAVDTRLLAPGDVFVALPGEQVDGGLFVDEALARGAGGVIAAPQHLEGRERAPFAIAVDDPHAALHALAAAWRGELDCHAIGITGAAGKTTTTDVLAGMLRPLMATHATRHGFNTHQGVAATIAGTPADTRALVVEVAQMGRGHIASKAAELQPTAAAITNIGPEHLGLVGTVADVARNKAELIAALPPGAPCIVPAHEPLLEPYLRDDLRTVRHGAGGDVALRGVRGGVAELDWGGERLELRLPPGFDQLHNLDNVVTASAVMWALGLRPRTELTVERSPLRWQLVRIGEVEVVLDCAKTSPLALRRAIDAFVAERCDGRRMLVLSYLPDLGDATDRYHQEAGEHATGQGIDVLVTVGEQARTFHRGFGGERHCVATPTDARALLEEIGRPGDRALVKGRRWERLEDIAA